MPVYDELIEELLGTAVTYGPGFANHGPMALEALDHLGLEAAMAPFAEHYFPRLEPKVATAEAADDIDAFVREQLVGLVGEVAALAGHGLLRVGHALRALGRSDSKIRRADVVEAVTYWKTDTGIAGPQVLDGDQSLAAATANIPSLIADDRDGMLTVPLARAATDPGLAERIGSIRPAIDIAERFDALSAEAAHRYLVEPESSFMFIHGVTVPNMARELLPFVDAANARRLEAAVVTMVFAAIASFALGQTGSPPAHDIGPDDLPRLCRAAAESADDHTIKFTDACRSLHSRTGEPVFLQAIAHRVAATS